MLPPVLDTLFQILAADTRRGLVGRQPAEGLGGYKNAGYLVAAMADRLDRLVTRRALRGQLSALRRWLAEAPAAGITVERSRWYGWRLVPGSCDGAARSAHRQLQPRH